MPDQLVATPTTRAQVAEEDVEFCSASGHIDLATTPAFRARMAHRLDSGPSALVVDLTRVTFVGTAGVAALIAANARAERMGTYFAVVADNHQVLRSLRVTGADRVLPVCSTLTEAACAAETGTPDIPIPRTGR
ncbi:MAG: STAS domain-containing protein [Saccharothrix sp.]|nr:STAS domain-containing protein [Saccharothrix sp.]